MDNKRLLQELNRPAPLPRETREWIASSVLPMLALAERRITEQELKKLEALVAKVPDHPPTRGPSEFRIKFWTTIAESTQNPLMIEATKLWANGMQMREQQTGIDSSGPERIIPKAMYLGLILALRRGSGAPALWADVIDRMID